MKRTVLQRLCPPSFVALVLLCVPGWVPGGFCQVNFPTMSPGYSTYTSYTTDGTNIYTSVTVSGVVNGVCPSWLPAQLANECHSTVHTPQAYNLIGSAGGWEYGNATAWNSWLSMTNNQQIAATAGTEYTFTYSSSVICSFVGGAIYSVAPLTAFIGFAITTVQTVGDSGTGVCVTKPDCNGGVTPRCAVNPVDDGKPCSPGFECVSITLRYSQSGPFTCFPAGCTDYAKLPGPCTQ